jgi:hypothetical protein
VNFRDARLIKIFEVATRPRDLQPLRRHVDALNAVIPVPEQQQSDAAFAEEFGHRPMAIVGLRVAKVREAKHLATQCGLPAFTARSRICDSDQILRIRGGDVPR